jgi:hypothetical protein
MSDDLAGMSDPEFIAEPERLRVTESRPGRGRQSAGPVPVTPSLQLKIAAIEVLLAEPEQLGNDALEGDLYILRDRYRTGERP